jgi:hypothetical protein
MKKLIITSVLTATLLSSAVFAIDTRNVRCSAKYIYTVDGVEKTFTNTEEGHTYSTDDNSCKGTGVVNLAKKVGKRLKKKGFGYIGVKELKCKRGYMKFGLTAYSFKSSYKNCKPKHLKAFDSRVSKYLPN